MSDYYERLKAKWNEHVREEFPEQAEAIIEAFERVRFEVSEPAGQLAQIKRALGPEVGTQYMGSPLGNALAEVHAQTRVLDKLVDRIETATGQLTTKGASLEKRLEAVAKHVETEVDDPEHPVHELLNSIEEMLGTDSVLACAPTPQTQHYFVTVHMRLNHIRLALMERQS